MIGGKGSLIKGPIPQTIFTEMILLGLCCKGRTAYRAHGRVHPEKISITGPAEKIRFAAVNKVATAMASGRVYDVCKSTKDVHSPACLTNSSNGHLGLIPGHASFASSQLSLSATIAGKKGHRQHLSGLTGCIKQLFSLE